MATLVTLQKELALMGQVHNLKKTILLDPTNADTTRGPRPPCPIPISSTGIKLLGGPMGSSTSTELGPPSYVANYLADHFELKAKIIPYLDQLPQDIAFTLLRVCINSRPMYLTRILPPWLTADACELFDSLVDRSLSVITGFNAPLPPLAQAVRGLPLQLSGCSVRRLTDSRECAYSASFLTAAPHIRMCHSKIWRLMTNTNTRFFIRQQELFKSTVPNFQSFSSNQGLQTLQSTENTPPESQHNPGRGISSRGKERAKSSLRHTALTHPTADPGFDALCTVINTPTIALSTPSRTPTATHLDRQPHPDPEDSDDSDDDDHHPSSPLSQRSFQLVKDRALYKKVLASIPANSSYRAWFTGGRGKGSAPWLLHCSHGSGLLRLTPTDFAENLRLRLLLPMFNVQNENATWSCSCGRRLQSLQHGFDDHHGLGCRKSVLAKCDRHDRIKDFLIQQLKLLVRNGGIVSEHEVDVEGINGGRGKRTDILIKLGPDVYFIDVSVINNSCQIARRAGSGSKPGKASILRESSKTCDWSKVLDPVQLQRSFIPFVIETGGHLGTRGSDFLDKICGLQRLSFIPDDSVATTRRFISRGIATIIARSNAELTRQFRQNCRLTFTHNPSPPLPFQGFDNNADLRSDDGLPDEVTTAELLPQNIKRNHNSSSVLPIQPPSNPSPSAFRASLPPPESYNFGPSANPYSSSRPLPPTSITDMFQLQDQQDAPQDVFTDDWADVASSDSTHHQPPSLTEPPTNTLSSATLFNYPSADSSSPFSSVLFSPYSLRSDSTYPKVTYRQSQTSSSSTSCALLPLSTGTSAPIHLCMSSYCNNSHPLWECPSCSFSYCSSHLPAEAHPCTLNSSGPNSCSAPNCHTIADLCPCPTCTSLFCPEHIDHHEHQCQYTTSQAGPPGGPPDDFEDDQLTTRENILKFTEIRKRHASSTLQPKATEPTIPMTSLLQKYWTYWNLNRLRRPPQLPPRKIPKLSPLQSYSNSPNNFVDPTTSRSSTPLSECPQCLFGQCFTHDINLGLSPPISPSSSLPRSCSDRLTPLNTLKSSDHCILTDSAWEGSHDTSTPSSLNFIPRPNNRFLSLHHLSRWNSPPAQPTHIHPTSNISLANSALSPLPLTPKNLLKSSGTCSSAPVIPAILHPNGSLSPPDLFSNIPPIPRCKFAACTKPLEKPTRPLSHCTYCFEPFCVDHIFPHQYSLCPCIGSPSSPSLLTQDSNCPPPGTAFPRDPNLSAHELFCIRQHMFATSSSSSNSMALVSLPTQNNPFPPASVRSINPNPTFTLCAYTDGSKRANTAAAGWGVAVVQRDTSKDRDLLDPGTLVIELYGLVITNKKSSLSLGASAQTNNSGELTAIGETLLWFTHHRPHPRCPRLAILTDSDYCFKLFTGKSHSTSALVKKCLDLLSLCKESAPGISVHFMKVASHTGVHWNDRADQLANSGATGRSSNLGRHALQAPSPYTPPIEPPATSLTTLSTPNDGAKDINSEKVGSLEDIAQELAKVGPLEETTCSLINPSPLSELGQGEYL